MLARAQCCATMIDASLIYVGGKGSRVDEHDGWRSVQEAQFREREWVLF